MKLSRLIHPHWSRLALGLAAVLAVSLTLAVAPRAASAAPPAALDLAQLQTLLNAEPGGVNGVFDTVVGGSAGQLPTTIPMKVLAIVGGAGPEGALILFQADMTDPVMARIGNIAMGMSGSPLYVQDDGQRKLIGALSYGDVFTLGGLGLATPIQYMRAIEAGHDLGPTAATIKAVRPGLSPYRTRSVELAASVKSAGGATIRRIVVAPDQAVARVVAAGAGTVVFAPLEAVRIGGLPYASRIYKQLAAVFEARGFTVQRGLGTGPDGWDPTFSTPLVGGAALAAMYTDGDLWAGAIGTVTYVNGDHLLAFGHPMDWIGSTSLYLDNAYIDGIWGSSMAAYKLGEPGSVRGTITKDYGSGIAGRLDQTPAQVPVTSSATVTTDASRTASSLTYLAQKWADSPDGSYLAASATGVPILKASGLAGMPGSATTTTTVVVSDGVDTYTVVRRNLWDDAYDVQYDAIGDVGDILSTLTADPYGIAPATVRSVDLRTSADQTRRAATIAGVSVAGGLRVGHNVVRVILNAYGVLDQQTVDVPLDLPAGTPTEGTLAVAAANAGTSSGGGDTPAPDPTPPTRQTLAQVAAALNAAPTNDMISVTFTPGGGPVPVPLAAHASQATPIPEPSSPVTATAHSDWFVAGGVTKQTPAMTLWARPATVKKGQRTTLTGVLGNVISDASVKIYRRYLGTSPQILVATVTATAGGGSASFAYTTAALRRGAEFIAVYGGGDSALAGAASVTVRLKH
jgi:hypothetical protein